MEIRILKGPKPEAMPRRHPRVDYSKTMDEMTIGKSEHTVDLLHHFIREFRNVGDVTIRPSKTMIGIATSRKGICYVTQLGRNFIHVVFTFKEAYPDNLCFIKIAQVPGQQQFNHHCRIFLKEDINREVKKFMKLAFELGK
jgi:hypothetical protein